MMLEEEEINFAFYFTSARVLFNSFHFQHIRYTLRGWKRNWMGEGNEQVIESELLQ